MNTAKTVKTAKIVSVVILVALALILVFQNTEAVETKLLFATLTMPRAVLLLSCIAIGFVLGMVAAFMLRRRREASSS